MLLSLCRAILAVRQTRSPIADLVERDPHGFEFSRHYATHPKAGIRIWIANGAGYLHYEVAQETPPANPPHPPLWSGETKPCRAERRLIWSALRTIMDAAARDADRRNQDLLRSRIDSALAKATR